MRFRPNLRKRARSALGRIEKPLYRHRLFRVKSLALPDFLGIGAMKAGTTWLHSNLRCHPGIFLPEHKELYYFSYRFHDPLKRYAAYFAPGKGLVKGEITPGYSIIATERIRFIHRILPQLKLIFILRNPVDRSWSEAFMNLVKKKNRSCQDVDDDEFFAYFQSRSCRQRSDYRTIIDNWTAVFPAEQLCTLFFEDIHERPRELLEHVFAFLGVDTPVDWGAFPYQRPVIPVYEPYGGVHRGHVATEHAPSSVFMPEKFREYLYVLHRDELKELHDRYGKPVERWLDRQSLDGAQTPPSGPLEASSVSAPGVD